MSKCLAHFSYMHQGWAVSVTASARRDRSFWVTVMIHDRDQKTSATVMIMAFERKAITVTARDRDRDSR